MARPASVAYGGKFIALYISRKLSRKCHKNSGKEREGWEGEGRRVRGGVAKLCWFFASL
jgi:hypothetical protein